MDRLKEIIQVIDRPLAFAERGGAVALKDLGRFISRQVTDALAEHVRPSAIEAELVRLAQLFTDYEQLSPGMRAARVTEARAVIVRLDQAVNPPPPTSGRPAYRLSDYSVQYIRGVGPKKAEALGRIGIRTVEDAVWMLPWRYEDRSQCRSISSLVPGEAAMIEAQVERMASKVTNFKRRKLVEVAVADRTGRLHLIWFNQAYLAETFHVGQRLMLYGQVKPRNGRWTDLQMENPAFEILTDAVDAHRADLTHMGRIVPIYHARETKSRMMLSDRLRAMMKIIVDQYGRMPLSHCLWTCSGVVNCSHSGKPSVRSTSPSPPPILRN
jgi:ATP-dependent DNA helicase RecG